MTNPLCPFCGATLRFNDRLVDVETMKATQSVWFCPNCDRFFDDDDLAEIKIIGTDAYLTKEAKWEERVICGDGSNGVENG